MKRTKIKKILVLRKIFKMVFIAQNKQPILVKEDYHHQSKFLKVVKALNPDKFKKLIFFPIFSKKHN